MAEKKSNLTEKIKMTKQSLEEIGVQIKSLLKGVKANIEDYRFTVSTDARGINIEFFVKASLKKSRKK